MDLFVSISDKQDEVTIRSISDDDEMVCEIMTTITAGRKAMDIPFEIFIEVGSGKHTLKSLQKRIVTDAI